MIKITTSQMVSVPLRRRGGRPGPDRRQWVIRPDDLVVLAFDLMNLRVAPAAEHEPATLVKQGPGAAYLVAWFPPQHVLEQAYFTTVPNYPVKIPSNPGQTPPLTDADQGKSAIDPLDPPPIDARIAGWSRLVFVVPDDKLPIEWTLEGLLKAMRELELSVAANALPPREKRHFLQDVLVASVKDAALFTAPAVSSGAGAPAAPMAQAPMTDVDQRAATFAAVAAAPVAGSARVFAVARSRRKVRTIGNALGLTTVTGAATKAIAALYEDDLIGKVVGPVLRRPAPAAPAATQTALELPFRVILSPNRFGAWFHADTPMTSAETGHTELWHTRLGVRREDGTLIDGDDPLRKLRAVWTTEPPEPKTPPPDSPVPVPGHSNDFPFRASLDGFDRHNVVHLSSNFRLVDGRNPNAYYEPEPLDVDLLALSSLGAWIDSRGGWDFPQPRGLSVEEWRHRATLGRDHYVRVVYAGFLFPFGHRASIVKITERQFHGDLTGNPAYLRQRMFLIVREPLKTFRATGLKYDGPDSKRTGEQYDLMMPFEAVRILTRVSPLLDPPETDDIDNRFQGCFWPYVGGQPFKFHLVATDTDGNQVDMVMPLIFVGKEETDKDFPPSIVPTSVVKAYETAVWPLGSKTLRATVPLHGQKLAFAESHGPNDTSFAAQTLTFGGEVPAQQKFNQLGWRKLRFFPVVRKAQIDVPSLQRIARTTTPASVVFHGRYLREGFAGSNSGQVFLAADPDPAAAKLGVKFSGQGDRSGGLITPDMQLSGLSRVTGPVSGDVDTVSTGSFTPGAWFGAIAGAKLFGVFSLTDILHDVGFDEPEKLPQFVGQSLNQVEEVISGLERLQKLTDVNAAAETSAVASVLDQLLDKTTGSIPALLAGGGAGAVAGQLATLKTELAALAATLPGSALPSGPKALIEQLRASLAKPIDAVLANVGLLQQFADGDVLPQALHARFEWRPVIKAFGPFKPSGDRNLVLSVEAADAQGGGDEVFTVTCALNDFVLDLEVLILTFERIQIQAVAGKKMDVDVKFTGFVFAGPLSFIETLREVIPFDGFSDPPDIQVSPSGITAGFTMGLPNLSFGVFSLENLSLGAGFNVPFIGPPVSTWFQFCTRENPSRLTVSLFGGGFFFGVTVNPDGLQIFEGAIEFGAAISVNFGVASGSVSAMAGLYFKIESSDVTLAGYFRLRGEVEALGIVTVSIELYLEMRYESASGKCVGTATLTIEVDVTLFSVSVSISCSKKFAGAGADPTLFELLDVQPDATSADWNAYCAAFA
jgi:hypothetical protein